MSTSVADLFVILDSVTDPFSKGMKKAASDAESESSKMSKALRGVGAVGLGLATTVVGVGVASADLAIKFQSTMATLSTQAGVAKSQLGSLSNGVLSLAGQVGFSPDSLAEALYHIESSFASVGITGPKALSLLKIAAEGAAVGHANLVDVTNALDAAVASGIPGVQDFSQAMGVLNATVGAGDMQMQDLADAFSTGLLANVKSYGLSITDVGAALAVFGDNNIRGAAAATDLRMAVQAMAVPAKAGADQLAAMGMSTTQMAKDMQSGGLLKALEDLKAHMDAAKVSTKEQGQVLTTVFGKKAGGGILVLYDQLDRLKSKYPDLTKGANNFGSAWEQTKSTIQQQFNDIRSGADALGVRLGQALLPQLSKLITEGQNALGQIESGFEGKSVQGPKVNLHNAHLNQDMAPVAQAQTSLQRFGETLHGALQSTEAFMQKLRPLADDFGRFATEAWQAGGKIVVGLKPVAQLLGGALFVGLESVGKILANVVGPALKEFADLIDAHQGTVKFFADVILGGLIVKMTVLGAINAAKGIVDLATAIVSFPMNQASAIGDAFKGLKTAVSGSEIRNGEQEIKGLAGAFSELKGKVGGTFDRFALFDPSKLAALSKAGQDIRDVETAAGEGEQLALFEADINGIVQVAEKGPEQLALFDVAVEGVGTAAADAEASAGSLVGTLGKFALAGGIIGGVIGGAALLGTTLGKLGDAGQTSTVSVDELTTQLRLLADGSSQASRGMINSAVAMASFMGKGSQAANELDQSLTQLVTSGQSGEASAEFEQISKNLEHLGVSASAVAGYFPLYTQAIKDAGAAAKTTDGEVSDMLGTIQQQQAMTQFQGDLQSLTQSIKDNGKALTGNSAAAQANQAAIQQGASDIANFYQQQRNAGVGIIAATDQMNSQIKALEQTAIKAGMSKGAVDTYIATLLGIPVSRVTQIIADTDPATKGVEALIKKINGSKATITVYEDSSGTVVAPGSGGRKARAQGGPVEAMNTYLVGENGPELVTFGASGYVTPNSMLQPAILAGAHGRSGGAGGGGTVVNNYYVTNVAGSVLSDKRLEMLVRTVVLRYNNRNSSNGLSLPA